MAWRYNDDSDDDFEELRWNRNHRLNTRDSYFSRIQQSVAEEENKSMTLEEEDILFSKINHYLKKPFTLLGILTLQKLAFIPPSVSEDRLKEMAVIICRNVFSPLTAISDYILEYVDFCKGFAYLQVRTNEGVSWTFEQILISTFLDELSKKFNYPQRLRHLLENRNIPLEKKEKWLGRQIEDQRRMFKISTDKSINFLNKLFQLYPEIVYRVVEFLLYKSRHEDGFDYLCALLRTVRNQGELTEIELTNISEMKVIHWQRNKNNNLVRLQCPQEPLAAEKKELKYLLESIDTLLKLTFELEEFKNKAERANLQVRILNPVPNLNCPQDYIKYCIKHCLLSENLNPIDDLKICEDEDNYEDKYDCDIYTLRSKDFTGYSQLLFWNGLKVKILSKKSEETSLRGSKRGFRHGSNFRYRSNK